MTIDPDSEFSVVPASLSSETLGLLDFLAERPLAKYPRRTDRDKLLWAMRDLRATVRYEVYGTAPGFVVTLDDVDKLLRSPGLSERVWARLLNSELRDQLPLPHAPSGRPRQQARALRWFRSVADFVRGR